MAVIPISFVTLCSAGVVFLNAALLFWLEPLFAKMILPILGGSPSVWTTSMCFYQWVLLFGYWMADRWGRYRHSWISIGLMGGLLVAGMFFLPARVPLLERVPLDKNPLPWVVWALGAGIGIPFLALSVNGLLLQKWFSRWSFRPYDMYRASNAGSLAALLAFPFLLERVFPIQFQVRLWMAGYAVLTLFTIGVGVLLQKISPQARPEPLSKPAMGTISARPMDWVIWAFIPSSLMLGVTTYITTDIAPIPLLWVLPLSFYLLSFVWMFNERSQLIFNGANRAFPILILPLVLLLMNETSRPVWMVIPLHLIMGFLAGLIFHGRLYQSRPHQQELTRFYLWVGLGGALGGLFNALLGPVIFKEIWEYPLVLVLASLLRPAPDESAVRFNRGDFIWPLFMGGATATLLWFVKVMSIFPATFNLKIFLAIPIILCFLFSNRPIRFGLGLGLVLLAAITFPDPTGRVIEVKRSFFGVNRVVWDKAGPYHWLTHGTTVHGGQSLLPERKHEPLTYFHPLGPMGSVFQVFHKTNPGQSIAVIGLGTGSLASYTRTNQVIRFFEIDPVVKDFATNPALFTFLKEAPGTPDIVLGDARLTIEKEPDHRFGLLVVDAFGSDAIPVHLLTQEAVTLYTRKLREDGWLVFNISNQFVDLAPVLAAIGEAMGFQTWLGEEKSLSALDITKGRLPSRWLVLSRSSGVGQQLARDPRWIHVMPQPRRLWTDDYSNIFSVFKWK